MLEALGCTPVEDAVYQHLLGRASGNAESVAAAVGTTAGEAAAALASLAVRGLTTRGPGGAYLAAPPNVAVRALLLRRQEELLDAESRLENLIDTYRRGSALRGVTEIIEVVVDPTALRDRVTRMMLDAREEFLAIVTPPFAVIPPEQGGAISIKVSGANRTVYDRSVLEIPGALAMMRANVGAEDEWRIHPNAPMKLFIVDRRIALLSAVYADTGPPGSMFVHRSTLLDALAGYFDLIWSQAVPLTLDGERAATNTSPLSTEDQVLLTLLLAGFTDQAIAARLGVGHRSVQRRVRALMDLAGVDTRVQLGWHAHRNAWLGADQVTSP